MNTTKSELDQNLQIKQIQSSKVVIAKSHNRFFVQMEQPPENVEDASLLEANVPKRYPQPDSKDVDVVIITAARGEQPALLCVKDYPEQSEEDARKQWERRKLRGAYTYYYRSLTCENKKNIKIAAVETLDQGSEQAGHYATKFVERLHPKCLAVVGICAGKRGVAKLGDVIVPDRIFKVRDFADTKVYPTDFWWARSVREYEGKDKNYLNWQSNLGVERPISYKNRKNWLLYTQYMYQLNPQQNPRPNQHKHKKIKCPEYETVETALCNEGLLCLGNEADLVLTKDGTDEIERKIRQHGSLEKILGNPICPEVLLRPVGTGDNLAEDVDFWETMPGEQRQVYAAGYEMEFFAVAEVAMQERIKMIGAKSVADFADPNRKSDPFYSEFRQYACKTSATFLIHFLKHHFFD